MKKKSFIFNIILWIIMLGILFFLAFMSYDLFNQENEPLVPESVQTFIKGVTNPEKPSPATSPMTQTTEEKIITTKENPTTEETSTSEEEETNGEEGDQGDSENTEGEGE